MRFTQFLIEAPDQKPQQGDWIKRQKKADQQRNRRATRKRADINQQKMQANANPQQAPQAGTTPATNDTIEPPANKFQKAEKKEQIKTMAPVDPALQPLLQAAKGDRQLSVELQTLLGAIYQTKRTNPQVELSVPKLVVGSKNKELLQKMFDLAKDKDLGQLAAMSQEVKRTGAMPGTGQAQPPNGMTGHVPQTPGQTPAGKTMLQKLITTIQQAAKSLSPADMRAARKKLDQAAQNAKPNPSNNATIPIGKPVVTSG